MKRPQVDVKFASFKLTEVGSQLTAEFTDLANLARQFAPEL